MAQSLFKCITGFGFSVLSAVLGKMGYRVRRNEHLDFFEPLLARRLQQTRHFFFVQIGANDGIFADPIRAFVTRTGVAGLAVEPLQDMYARLVENYRSYPQVKTANVAIHPSARSLELHRVDPTRAAELGEWTQGIASFKESHHRVNAVPSEAMIRETVPCMTLTELFEQYGVTHVDLLQIDTEGFDFEIIKLIDFQRIKPAIIHFEHGMPDRTMSLADFKECSAFLMDRGYLVLAEPYDATAYLPEMI